MRRERRSFALLGAALWTITAMGCASTSLGAQEPRLAPAGSLSQHAFTLAELRGDFDFLKRTLLVWNPLAYADKKALDAQIASQAAKLRDGMGELDLYRVLAPVVAAARCGHTGLRFSAGSDAFLREHAKYFPLQVRFVGAHLYVLNPLEVRGIPAEAEITDINGRSTGEILATLLDGITADGENLTKKYAVINGSFNDQYLFLVESTGRFAIQFIDPSGGDSQSVTADGITKDALEEETRQAGPIRGEPQPYSSTFDAPGIATLTIRTFPYAGPAQEQYKAFLEQFFTALREHRVSTLILDLRNNWGGDPWSSAPLFTHLIKEPAAYFAEGTQWYGALSQPLDPAPNAFQGRLLVLANGTCFSSTGHLCSLLRFHGRATFIGEETGGSFTCTDGSTDFVLRSSGLIFHCSTHEFQTAVTSLTRGRGILPDFEVLSTIDDLVNDRDVQRAFALTLAGGNQ
jgi:hypothetical protein